MLFVKLHKRALRRVQMLSTLRNNFMMRNGSNANNYFLEAPSRESCRPTNNAPSPLFPELQPQPHQQQQQKQQGWTRIVCMSDTHGKHRDIPFLPRGDILVHAGDFTKYGETHAVEDLSRYFQQQQERRHGFQKVLAVAGNHDMTFHPDYYEKTWSRRIRSFDPTETRQALEKNCTYLEDSSTQLKTTSMMEQDERYHQYNNDNGSTAAAASHNDDIIVAYGSPWTPSFFNWAFNLKRGEALQEVWSKIPTNTDVLITHGPPQGRGDMTLHSGHFGCYHLLHEIQHRVKPRLHIYGHIHEGYGTSFDGQTLYVNASCLDIGYEAINPCIVVDLPHDTFQPAMVVKPHHPWMMNNNTQDAVVADFVAWLYQNGYLTVAQAVMEKSGARHNILPLQLPNNLFSGAAYQSLCDQFGWKRRKHGPAKQELRTALCQLYAESFLY